MLSGPPLDSDKQQVPFVAATGLNITGMALRMNSCKACADASTNLRNLQLDRPAVTALIECRHDWASTKTRMN